ncbi:hypothetical protein [Dactylosporangium sp. NPDC051541]|uniref:hypothetical protein n=1 Tax=Dactylosporangium sp. NPDC051541 TaxID=3363977 RepID=UPI00379D8436
MHTRLSIKIRKPSSEEVVRPCDGSENNRLALTVKIDGRTVADMTATSGRIDRRALLLGAAATGAATLLPGTAGATPTSADLSTRLNAVPLGTDQPIPPVLRSRQALALETTRLASLPITQLGTTYNLAQVVRWLDVDHFAVGRWDGTMSIFSFETAPFAGPVITAAVNTPAAQGVQMLTPMPNMSVVTSNNEESFLLWGSTSGRWSDLRVCASVHYDSALGVATSGTWFPVGDSSTLVVGHTSGYISQWSFNPTRRTLRLRNTVNLQNPHPVNPWGSHVMYGMCPLVPKGPNATVVCGSDDGYVSLVHVPTGSIRSQTVFNSAAQRGINCVSAQGNKLLVANCSVGAADDNLWYFSVNMSNWKISLVDSTNLIIDPTEIQSFNFDTKWGGFGGGSCWFAGTEEGALWMGTAEASLSVIGYQGLRDGSIGAALDYAAGPGRLAAVIHDLNQFATGAP